MLPSRWPTTKVNRRTPVTAETNFLPTWLCQKTARRETLTGAAVLAVATLIITPLGLKVTPSRSRSAGRRRLRGASRDDWGGDSTHRHHAKEEELRLDIGDGIGPLSSSE